MDGKKNYDSIIKIDPTSINWFPTVGLKLTNACALKCDFCCEPERNIKTTKLSEFIKIVDHLWDNGTKRLCLVGGDPLLYKNLKELTNYSKKKGFYNLLLTADGNRLIKMIENLKDSIDGVRLSIHGLNQAHDNVVKSEGSFDNLSKSIDILIDYGISTMVSSVITNDNYDNIEELANWCFSKNVEKFYLYGLLNSGLGNGYVEKNGKPSKEMFHILVNKLKAKYDNTKMSIKFYDYTENSECILVYGSGDIIIDPYFDSPTFQLKIGNILKDSKVNIWDNFSTDENNIKGYKNHLNNAI